MGLRATGLDQGLCSRDCSLPCDGDGRVGDIAHPTIQVPRSSRRKVRSVRPFTFWTAGSNRSCLAGHADAVPKTRGP